MEQLLGGSEEWPVKGREEGSEVQKSVGCEKRRLGGCEEQLPGGCKAWTLVCVLRGAGPGDNWRGGGVLLGAATDV